MNNTIGVTYHTPTTIFNFDPAGSGLAIFDENEYLIAVSSAIAIATPTITNRNRNEKKKKKKNYNLQFTI